MPVQLEIGVGDCRNVNTCYGVWNVANAHSVGPEIDADRGDVSGDL